MRSVICVVIAPLVLVGCSESPRPLASGSPLSGTVWKHSLRAAVSENSGAPIPREAQVEVFESVIVIRLPDGSRRIVPLDCVSDLTLR
jgi:hypothetical protein